MEIFGFIGAVEKHWTQTGTS